MKVVVIAADAHKRELLEKPVNAGVEYVWVQTLDELNANREAAALIDLEFRPDTDRIKRLAFFLPKPVFINSVAFNLGETNPSFIRLNAWPGFLKHGICETSAIGEMQISAAKKFFDQAGWAYRFVPDQKGMISARVLAMVINEAYYALEAGVSTKSEIDIAMKLGANYPYGPFEWSAIIGLHHIYELLMELYKKEERYKASDLMKRELGINDNN